MGGIATRAVLLKRRLALWLVHLEGETTLDEGFEETLGLHYLGLISITGYQLEDHEWIGITL